MVMKAPGNAEEAIRQYEELRAKNEAKQEPKRTETKLSEIMQVRITPDTIEFNVSVPLDEKSDERIKKLVDKLEPYLEQKRLTRQAHRQASASPDIPKTPPLPYGINQIEWWPNKFPENVPAEKRGEYTSTNPPECAELRKVLENTGKPVEIQAQLYSLNTARTYVYRRPIGDAKK